MKDKFSHYICLYYDSGDDSDDRGGAVLFDHLDSSHKMV